MPLALHFASHLNYFEIVKVLVSHDPALSQERDKSGKIPTEYAQSCTIRTLLGGQSFVRRPKETQNFTFRLKRFVTEQLPKLGAPNEIKVESIIKRDVLGRNLVHRAAISGQVEEIQKLLGRLKPTDADTPDIFGDTRI